MKFRSNLPFPKEITPYFYTVILPLGIIAIFSFIVIIVFNFWNQKQHRITNLFSYIKDNIQNIHTNLEFLSTITYSEVVKYFVEQRPNNIRVKKGAILLEIDSQGYILTQVFLDENNNLVIDSSNTPYGRRFKVKNIDNELREIFEDKDLIIVE
ncbi:hypothetical protein F7734_43275 [Scytonema sp. UIC 10036]|uniref:hypothetical protein n=1 Tax=Scytonema sp. UIC 10036 TaxID=2304196 RepID=UPI0012DA043E|nr:hypothetical protein [Scytonema sp. UIC 10036]MUG98756.1 hypothetical protein [Scytonema sp. UIC 10036]